MHTQPQRIQRGQPDPFTIIANHQSTDIPAFEHSAKEQREKLLWKYKSGIVEEQRPYLTPTELVGSHILKNLNFFHIVHSI